MFSSCLWLAPVCPSLSPSLCDKAPSTQASLGALQVELGSEGNAQVQKTMAQVYSHVDRQKW